MYLERRRDSASESALGARKRVGELRDINPGAMRGRIEEREVDTGQRPGVSSDASDELTRLRRENAELRRANETLETALRL